METEIKDVDVKLLKDQEENAPLSLGHWLKLKLTDEEKKTIADKILKEIDRIEQDRKDVYDKIKMYRNMYDQIVEETTTPFPGAFNVCVPLAPKNVDACVSQTEEAFDDVDPKWIIETPPDKNLIASRDMQEQTLGYYSDQYMQDSEAWGKVYHDAFLLGTGWLCMVFKRDFIKTRDFKEYETLEEFQADYPGNGWMKYPKYIEQLARGQKVSVVVEIEQEVCRSAKPEHAEWEDIYVPIKTNGLEGMMNARIVARYVPKRWEEIYTLEKKGDFNEGVSEQLKHIYDNDGNMTTDIDPEYLKKVYDTFEVRYFVDIDSDEMEECCLFNIEKSRKIVLRDIRYPYNHMRPYAIPYYIQRTRSGIYQTGLGEKLFYLNITANGIINHLLNACMIANSLSLKVRKDTDAARAMYEHQWYPGSILELIDPNDVQQFQFATPNLSAMINLFAIVEKFSEDVSGIVNYVLGQESESDPQAPASKTIALMKKSELKLRRYIWNLKKSNNEAGYQALQLIKQYIPVEKIAEIMGMEVNQVKILLKQPLKAITQSSGFAIERMFGQRDNVNMINILSSEPLYAGDPVRRMKGYRIIAKDMGSNWDKKIEQLLPTPEEAAKQVADAKAQADAKKSAFIKGEVMKHFQGGGNSQDQGEVQKVAMEASDRYDQMMMEKVTMAQGQKPPQRGKK